MLIPKLRFKEFTGEWTDCKIKDVATVIGGGTPSTYNKKYWNGQIQWFTPTEINKKYIDKSNRTITNEGLNNSSAKLLPKGSILLTTRATLGQVSILLNEATTNQGFQSLIANKNINNEFLYYLKNRFINKLIKKSFGSTFLEISKSNVESLEITIPTSKNEQNEIANFLSLLDKKIELQTKKIEVLKIYKKGTLDNNIIFNNEKSIELDKVVIYQEGPGVRNNQYTNAGVKLLNVGNFRKNNLVLSTTNRYISEKEAFGIYKHFLVNDGDLLIACSGIKSEYFKEKIAFAKKEHLPLCMNTSTMRFKTNSKNLSIEYLFYVLQTRNIKKQLDNILSGSAQLNFGPSHIKYIKIPLIDIKEQQKIVYLLEKITNKINCETEKFNLLIQFKKGLMQNMFV